MFFFLTIYTAYLKNPTNPDSSADNSATSSTAPGRNSSTPAVGGGDPSLAPAPSMPSAGLGMTPANGGVSSLPSNFMGPNYEVFDPLNWLLDGLVDFPYSYNAVQGLETQGIA